MSGGYEAIVEKSIKDIPAIPVMLSVMQMKLNLVGLLSK